MKRPGGLRGWVITEFLVLRLLVTSGGSPYYHIFSLREGTGHFSWDAAASVNVSGPSSLPAVSTMVCFRHGSIAWEIHVASDNAARTEAEFQHTIETFRILN